MNSWQAYPKIFNLGHSAISNLTMVEVNVEEKIDGSQFSFGVSLMGSLHIRSKSADINPAEPPQMFASAVETVKTLAPWLTPNWTYRGEVLSKPKHGVLAYDRIPAHNIILFDVNDGEGSYLLYEAKQAEAERLGLEVVPRIYTGMLASPEVLRIFLDRISVLGGQKIEGVVVKPAAYKFYGKDGKVLMGKFVSETFREIMGAKAVKETPEPMEIVESIAHSLTTQARWHKAVQHLAEAGKLENSPRDIGPLIKEVAIDIEQECAEEIKAKLYEFAWPKIKRQVTNGLPEWYKEKLLEKQFENAA